ncbi:MAG TPA: hypothetical protein VFB25_00750 [Gaiellaceae bacterium]|nr:hypothetical protein [Gaiellaceae bacterium]
MLVGLAAVGGVSRAATEVAHIASVATGHTNFFGKKLTMAVNRTNAANGQYGGQQTSSDAKTTTASPNSGGSVTATTPGGGTVTISWPAGTFPTNVLVVLDPTPPAITSTALVGESNKVVNIIFTDSSGHPLTTLPSTVAVTITSSGKGQQYVPVFSIDGGVTFSAIPLIGEATETVRDGGTPTLPDGWTIGYYVDANGNNVVLTSKPALLGVVYSANVNKSETGRTTPQAGSGKFGDPTRNHVGAPNLAQVGTVAMKGTKVPFSFHVDEQASIYISIYDSNGNPVWIARKGTTIRGHEYSGTPVHTLHLVILRPGQINTMLNAPAGTFKAGHTYRIRITAVDFDGHKVTQYTTFTA